MAGHYDLAEILNLEQIEVNLFRGRSPDPKRGRIFGGEVVAQALTAAYHTVDDRLCHSLQSYFIRPGDTTLPVLYQVEHSRDGKSFTTRRVIAIQKGEQIFNMACSFQEPETGYEHQDEMPAAPPPASVQEEIEFWRQSFKDRPEYLNTVKDDRPIEMRPVTPINPLTPQTAPPHHMVWIRALKDEGDAVPLNQALLAYASDFALLGTSMRPHGVFWWSNIQVASLDHIIWFHRPTNFSRWHLYVMDSPSAGGARGFNRGTLYREDGVLVASTAQEGLIRQR